jgi:PEP-CTERM motif
MSTPLHRSGLLAAALLCASLPPAMAAPLLIDFELAPPLTVIGPTQPDASYTEGGLQFTPTGGDAVVDLSFCAIGAESCIANNASVYLTALNGAQVTISGTQAFTLHALDAAFFPLPTPVGLFAGLPMGLSMVGSLWGGGTVSQTLALAEDSAFAGDFIFSSYAAQGMTALSSLTLSACVFTGPTCETSGAAFDALGLLSNDLQFAIDNLSITAVPEPAALWLLALGAVGLAGTRRRQAR